MKETEKETILIHEMDKIRNVMFENTAKLIETFNEANIQEEDTEETRAAKLEPLVNELFTTKIKHLEFELPADVIRSMIDRMAFSLADNDLYTLYATLKDVP